MTGKHDSIVIDKIIVCSNINSNIIFATYYFFYFVVFVILTTNFR